jgi:hypothetical protein
MDVIGEVFMLFTHPNPHVGQYFTPLNICTFLARVSLGSGEREVHDRLNVTGSIICPKGHDMLPIHSGQNMLPVSL